jgi:NAD-dependent epimerase/dehydratase family protein
MDALIGHTGFVGSNLASQHKFSALFNSKNIQEMRGGTFDSVVCAGVQAKKWLANQKPEADWAAIQKLLSILGAIQTRKFILISTVDVYSKPFHVTEETPVIGENHAYGKHRYAVEEFVREHFPSSLVLRLPGLFGHGLQKNVIFDLLNSNCLEQINPEGVFQYYSLDHLWNDIQRALTANLSLLNIATEPIKTEDIIQDYFPQQRERVGPSKPFTVNYDMHTKYGNLWNSSSENYLYNRQTVFREIGGFVARHQNIAK